LNWSKFAKVWNNSENQKKKRERNRENKKRPGEPIQPSPRFGHGPSRNKTRKGILSPPPSRWRPWPAGQFPLLPRAGVRGEPDSSCTVDPSPSRNPSLLSMSRAAYLTPTMPSLASFSLSSQRPTRSRWIPRRSSAVLRASQLKFDVYGERRPFFSLLSPSPLSGALSDDFLLPNPAEKQVRRPDPKRTGACTSPAASLSFVGMWSKPPIKWIRPSRPPEHRHSLAVVQNFLHRCRRSTSGRPRQRTHRNPNSPVSSPSSV
jgi:hypothetical protein